MIALVPVSYLTPSSSPANLLRSASTKILLLATDRRLESSPKPRRTPCLRRPNVKSEQCPARWELVFRMSAMKRIMLANKRWTL
jgi:hypothetical protein